MDPEATLRLLDQSISDLNLNQAREALGNYRAWRRRNGFEPQNVASSGKAGDVFADECERRLIDAEREKYPALPVVNLNGTSLDELLRLRVNAHTALRGALAAVSAAEPNARDYPRAGLYHLAKLHHARQLSALLVMRDSIDGEAELLQAIADQR